MKKRHILSFAAIALASFVYLACQKTDSIAGPAPGKGHIVENVQAGIAGRIIDDQQMPVAGAVVKVGMSHTTTDVNGNFSFSQLSVDRTAALVTAQKEGFFEGLRTIVVTEGKQHEVLIQLIKRIAVGAFSGSTGGTVHIPEAGGSLVFEGHTLMNPVNKAGYSGNVTVHAAFINPTASNFQDILPGALRGIDANNNITGLQSFGMLAVELSGTNGEKLQLAGGKKATLHFPIPATLQGEAPATIPLWFLNDSTGLWQEEGVATKAGNEYIGQVGHFSFWNCDAPFPVVEFSATVKSQAGEALPQLKTEILTSTGNNNIPGSGYTNEQGIVSGLIPANQSLTLKVYDRCGGILHSQTIGPFTAKSTITVTTPNQLLTGVTFSGIAIDCAFKPLTSGYVTLLLDNKYYRSNVTNGHFSLTANRCMTSAATATLTIHDAVNNQSSPAISIPFTGTTVSTGELSACGILPDQYIYYKLDDGEGGFTSPADSFRLNVYTSTEFYNTKIFGQTREGVNHPTISFEFNGTTPGIPLPSTPFWFTLLIDQHQWVHLDPLAGAVTEYGPVGDYIKGHFSGPIKDTANAGLRNNIDVRFKIRRTR